MVNRFGTGNMYTMQELIETECLTCTITKAYCESTACMSVTSDMQSWASKHNENSRVMFCNTNKEGYNDIIIILGCQVTDLAILNDIKTAERLHAENPKAHVYMGGCLAYRFDIELPEYVRRLEATRCEGVEINENGKNAVHWAKPFWVNDEHWNNGDSDTGPGRLFRNMYPLKIGAGCNGKCTYCTIRDTRGESYEYDAYRQVTEFLNHDNVVLISDSPTIKQVKDWCHLAKRYNKRISIRNVEPAVTVACSDELLKIAEEGLLNIFHCPIQSHNPDILKQMNRDVGLTMEAISIMESLQIYGVLIATNVIIDYDNDEQEKSGRIINQEDKSWLDKVFDYWSWNPYFDGHWDREKAKERFTKYLSD